LTLAVLAGLEDAAGLDRLLVALLRRLALIVAGRADVAADRLRLGLACLVGFDAIVRHGKAVIVLGACSLRGFRIGAVALDLDQHGAGHPAVAVMHLARRIHPAPHVGGARDGRTHENESPESQFAPHDR
jgi:hypothetical protein